MSLAENAPELMEFIQSNSYIPYDHYNDCPGEEEDRVINFHKLVEFLTQKESSSEEERNANEPAVGEIIKLKNGKFVKTCLVGGDLDCMHCALDDLADECSRMTCCSTDRKDHLDVCFVEV